LIVQGTERAYFGPTGQVRGSVNEDEVVEEPWFVVSMAEVVCCCVALEEV
jgi:hypothetical protein